MVLASLCVTEVVSWGLLYYAFPVLAPAISTDTGWSSVSVSAAFSGALVVSAVAGVPVGRVIDRRGPRQVMTIGSVLGAVALVVVATAPNGAVFVLGWLVAGAAMSGVLYPPAFAAVTGWFTTRRLAALTTLTLIAGLASTVFAPLVAAAGERLGWRGTYLAAAVALLALTVPIHAVALRRPWPAAQLRGADQRTPQRNYTSAVLASTQFRLLAVGFTTVSLAMYAALLALVPLMLERGLTTSVAAWILGLGGLGQVAGRLIYTPLAPRVSLPVRTAIVFVLVTGSIAALAVVPGPTGALVALSMLAGIGRGIATLLQATAITDRWGPRAYGHLSGMLGLPVLLSTALAPWAGAMLADVTGSYATGFAILSVLAGVGTVLMIASARSPTPVSSSRSGPPGSRSAPDHEP